MLRYIVFAVISTVLFGIQSFLYDTGAKKNFNVFELTFYFSITAAFLSLIIFLFNQSRISIKLILLFGVLYGVFFFIKTVLQMKALKFIPINVVFPITSSSLVILVLIGIFFLKEGLTSLRIIGISLAIFVILSFYLDKKSNIKNKNYKLGVLIAIIAMFFSAASALTNKLAAININRELFIFTAYIICAFISVIFFKNKRNKLSIKSAKLGILIGIINFLGFYSLLYAYSLGPLSIIAPIVAMYILVASILGYLIYKEELTLRKTILISLAIFAIIILSI